MGQIKKKGTAGQAKNYVTRSQAVRKLQITLPDFRRLCIFKGIYPREPRSKKKVSKSSTPLTTFYYAKDIQYLLHEPLLARFREHKAVSKKIARWLGRGEIGDAKRHEKNNSVKLSLDHVIKERYPTFVDALRDLDDALSLLFLFANLPSTSTVPHKTIALCQRLCLEFEHYLIVTNSLRKSFLSIKGIYYQATIQGQDVLWLVPYKFVQRVTGDVDYRIMATFVEFYTTLLGFVNYRLYTSIGLVYPPKFNAKSDELGGELTAFMLEGFGIDGPKQMEAAPNGDTPPQTNGHHELSEKVQRQIEGIQEPLEEDNQIIPHPDHTESSDPTTEIDTFNPLAPDADSLPQPAPSSDSYSTLFAPFTFYLSRETPKSSLEFLLRAFGCKRIGWPSDLGDGAFTHDEFDSSITHQVVDRPPLSHTNNNTPAPIVNGEAEADDENGGEKALQKHGALRMLNRIYIQPQWIWDCINALSLLRPDLYAPGATLPPHLSPWVKPSKDKYDPTIPLAEQEREGEADAAAIEAAPAVDGELVSEVEADSEPDGDENGGMQIDNQEADESDDLQSTSDVEADEFAGFDSDNAPVAKDDDDDPGRQYQRDLEAEALGLPPSSIPKTPKGILKPTVGAKQRARENKEGAEELERRKMMLSRKKRKLVDKMLYSNNQKDVESEKLRAKRRRIEQQRG